MARNSSGFPQGSTLGSIFFKICLCDLFTIMSDIVIVNFAEDGTPPQLKTLNDLLIHWKTIHAEFLNGFETN